MNCPCQSQKEFADCCEPYLSGEKVAPTAEALMRSRYTAYTRADIGYIKKTLASESQKGFDAASSLKWAKEADWIGLKILSTEDGGPGDKTGVVEFMVSYSQNGERLDHHEVSKFRKNGQGAWVFVDGEAHTHKEGEEHDHHHAKPVTVVRESPKVGRNDPCKCGSGKKYKKCCGSAQ